LKIDQFIIGAIWLGFMIWLLQINRSDFLLLWSSYSIAFACYAWLVFRKNTIGITFGLLLALTARLASFLFEPLLSDDYFRFIWDGMLMNNGIHPIAYVPSYLAAHPEVISINQELFKGLNSPDYFSVYPPVTQWIFGLSFWISGSDIAANIFCYKTVLCGADIAIVYLLHKLLSLRNLPSRRILIFALNPLIVLEYAGNLHMDGLMIAGLLAAIFFSEKNKLAGGIAAMTFSVLTKMLTLVLLPFMPKKMYWKRIIPFSMGTLALTGLAFWFSFGTHTGWLTSIHLWFQSFEFNASLYYLGRYIGFLIKGYNTISFLGPALAILFLLCSFLVWLKYYHNTGMDWAHAMLFILTMYFLCSTTVHPWYIGILLVLSVLSLHMYPVVWTYLVFLSYSHYQGGTFMENHVLIATEYLLLLGFMFMEWRFKKNTLLHAMEHKKTLA
jgi:alpha-1,6-mannosyltransferase